MCVRAAFPHIQATKVTMSTEPRALDSRFWEWSHHGVEGFFEGWGIFRFQMGNEEKKRKNFANLGGSGDNEEPI